MNDKYQWVVLEEGKKAVIFNDEYEAILYAESPEGRKAKRQTLEVKISVGKQERIEDDK